MPCSRKVCLRFSSAKEHTTSTSSRPVWTSLDSSGKTEAGIDDHAQQGAASGTSAAIGEQRIVGNDGAHADHDGVTLVTKFLDVGSRHFAGDPSAAGGCGTERGRIFGFARGRRDLSVECHRRFQSDQRRLATDVVRESLVHSLTLFSEQSGRHRDTGFPQSREALSTHQRVGISDSSDYAS